MKHDVKTFHLEKESYLLWKIQTQLATATIYSITPYDILSNTTNKSWKTQSLVAQSITTIQPFFNLLMEFLILSTVSSANSSWTQQSSSLPALSYGSFHSCWLGHWMELQCLPLVEMFSWGTMTSGHHVYPQVIVIILWFHWTGHRLTLRWSKQANSINIS